MENVITTKKPRFFKPLKVKDWKDLIVDFSMGIINGALIIAKVKTVEDALENWLNIVKDIGWETTEEELLWKLITRAMWRAVYKLIDDSKSIFPLRSEEDSKKLGKTIRPRVEELLVGRELTIDERFFDSPGKCDLVENAKALLKDLLSAVIEPLQAESLTGRLPSFFVYELHDEWRSKADVYKPIQDYFVGSPFVRAKTAERDWARYSSFLRRKSEKTVFGSCFGLSQLYVRLNASYTESLSKNIAIPSTSAMKESHENERQVAVDLEEYLLDWLNDNDPQDAERIISGGPGTGKSSFAKIFAAKLANEKNVRVLFIPLHRIDVSGNVIDEIGDYLLTDFTENPLKDPAANLLVVFDGLDELTETGRKYTEVAKEFVDKVQNKLTGHNRNGRCVRVLYTGRVLVAQSVESSFDKYQVLSLLPYFVDKNERGKYTYNNGLLEIDKRNEWWKKYGELTGQSFDVVPEAFRDGKLAELTAQPLLNYMVAITSEACVNAAQVTSLNEIYSRLLTGVYRRDWEERQFRCLSGMGEADYPLVFETIAVAAWHGAGRTVSVAEINTARKESDYVITWEAFQKGEEAGISNMLTAFYFRQVKEGLLGEKRFEFTHKSFREYLTAQRIIRTLKDDMHEKFEEQTRRPHRELWPKEKALDSWRKLCAPTAMDSDLFQFLADEMELRFRDDPESVLGWQDMLCTLIGYVATEGLPPAEPRPPFQDEQRLRRNAETGLLAAHSACALATNKCSEVKWGDDQTTANSWLRRLGISPDELFFKRCLNHIRWQNQSFYAISLRGAYLAGAEIISDPFRYPIYNRPIGRFGGKDLWWLVLEEDKENHKALLLALDCVTHREYHSEWVGITWKDCDLRKWLNEDFFKYAFREDKGCILSVTVHTDDNSEYNTSGGEDAEAQKLFLLSLEEVKKYFKVEEYYKPDENLVTRLNGEAVWWWLRSPGRRGDFAAFVHTDGSVRGYGSYVDWPEGAVRPAFWLNLQS